jgi:ATP-dependent phosphoenolpyruvate carboxykinase
MTALHQSSLGSDASKPSAIVFTFSSPFLPLDRWEQARLLGLVILFTNLAQFRLYLVMTGNPVNV